MRIGLGERRPAGDALGLGGTGDQLVAQLDGRLLAMLLVAGADALALVVGHQRQVDHAGEGALVEFDRRPGIHHRQVVEEDFAVVGAVLSHQYTSTA